MDVLAYVLGWHEDIVLQYPEHGLLGIDGIRATKARWLQAGVCTLALLFALMDGQH